MSYRTPAFESGRPGFTSNAESRTLMHGLVREGDGRTDQTEVRLLQVGSSQTGIPLEALRFSRAPVALAATGTTALAPRPVVLLVGQQHGDEPAGAEALIVIAQELSAGALASVPALSDVGAGSYYVGLDQAPANLVIAALEPDSPSGFVTNRIVTDPRSQARVLMRPEMKATPMP